MGTHLTIDARAKQVHASVDAPGEDTTLFAVDLITDTWDDFQYFLDQARAFERSGDLRRRNRYVRVATAALFSHLDGIVSGIFEVLSAKKSFARYVAKRSHFAPLKVKAQAIHNYLEAEHQRQLSGLNFDLKLLRDILNHPSASKPIQKSPEAITTLGMLDVYGISIEDLEAAGIEINDWLNAVCSTVPFPRFIDTKKAVDDLTRALGAPPGDPREF